jgi:hypothetical protein
VKILETRFWEKLVEGSFWKNLENKLKRRGPECLDAGTLGFQGYVDDDVAAVAYVKKLQTRTSVDDGPQRFVGDAAAAY